MTRVAVVHDYLTQHGGAERVALHLVTSTFPGAPLFTTIHDPAGTYPEFDDVDVRTTRLQGRVDPSRFRWAAPRFAAALRDLDLSDFDLVVASSSGFAHHVRHPALHVYCYTPPRFLYDTAGYLGNVGAGAVVGAALAPMRRTDRRAARAARSYAAISEATRDRIVATYGREAEVIHAPVVTDHLPASLTPLPSEPRALVVSRLLPYKRVDLAVAACRLADIPLTVVGEGPEEAALRNLAGADVTFLGRLRDEDFRSLHADHSLVLLPGREDFGLAPLEANHAGRPAIALAEGGALETVAHGDSGLLVDQATPEALAAAIRDALGRRWDPDVLRAHARGFSGDAFDERIRAWVAT